MQNQKVREKFRFHLNEFCSSRSVRPHLNHSYYANSFEITIGELQRWNDNRSKRNVSKNVQQNQLKILEKTIGNSTLETKIQMLREHLAEKDVQIEMAEKCETHWREQCQAIRACHFLMESL